MAASTLPAPAEALRGKIEEVEGPIVSASEIEIGAPAESVWKVLTDFERWPAWNPDIKAMTADSGDVGEGFVFRWKAGPGEITSTVVEVHPPHRIVWNGKTLGIDAHHVWQIVPRGDRTLVHTEESYRGLVAQLFRTPLKRALEGGLDRGLVYLKREVEGRKSHASS